MRNTYNNFLFPSALYPQTGQRLSDLEKAQEILASELEQSLEALARSALLVA